MEGCREGCVGAPIRASQRKVGGGISIRFERLEEKWRNLWDVGVTESNILGN